MKKMLILTVAVLIFSSCSRPENTLTPLSTEDTAQSSQASSTGYVIDADDFYSVSAMETLPDAAELTGDERTWLVRMREEEKLARDVYNALGDKWRMPIFSNIAKSEQTHTDAIKTLLIRYQVEDPVATDVVGSFQLEEMQRLYTDLVTHGSESLLDALVIGATIEDMDIFDLDIAMKETSKADIRTVYANLQKGSRNHMRAFVRQIRNQEDTYTPQYISPELFNQIISSSQEKGRLQ